MKPIYKQLQIITNIEEFDNYFIKSIIPCNDNYKYTLINMHNNKQIIVDETIIETYFELTTNELMEKVKKAHKIIK